MTEHCDPQKIQEYLLDAWLCIQKHLHLHPSFLLFKSSKFLKKRKHIVPSTKSDYLIVVFRNSVRLSKGQLENFSDLPEDGKIFRTWEDNGVARFVLTHPSYNCISYCVIRNNNEHIRELEKYAKLLTALNNPTYLKIQRCE